MSTIKPVFNDKDSELVFGLFEECVVDMFGAPTFGMCYGGGMRHQLLDVGMCGVARGYLDKFTTIAPLVTYGITVKQMPPLDLGGRYQLDADERAYVPSVAVYKQTKTDNEGKTYEVLSIGISGDVLQGDITGYPAQVDGYYRKQSNNIWASATLGNAAKRQYQAKVETSLMAIDYDNEVFHKNFQEPLHFLRDGKRKPGYNGAPHIAAIYAVPVPVTALMDFLDDKYSMMGWVSLNDLQNLGYMQQARAEMLEEDPNHSKIEYGFAKADLQERIGHLINIPLEPWSLALVTDDHDELERYLRGVTYKQS